VAMRKLTQKSVISAIAVSLVLVPLQASFAKDTKSTKTSKVTEAKKSPLGVAATNPVAKSICKSTATVKHASPLFDPSNLHVSTASAVNKTFTFDTNCGQIVVEAKASDAPITVQVLTALAQSGFYNKSLCHRLTTSGLFVIQCGDPSGIGRSWPYYFDDENLPTVVSNDYPEGTVAMANAGRTQSGRGTNGSQFFFVYADTTLPPNYTIWGKITKGLDILKYVAAQGVLGGKSDGWPKQTFAIEKLTVN